MRLARLMNRVVDMSVFVGQDSMVMASIVNRASLAAMSLITVIVMLNAYTIPSPLVIDASAKRSSI